MPIAELGYRAWNGVRRGRLARCLAITRSDIGVAYRGSKLLRRFLIVAWAPLFVFGLGFFAIGYASDPHNSLDEGNLLGEVVRGILPPQVLDALRSNPQMFLPALWTIAFFAFFTYTQSLLAMIVIAIVAPPLISRDVRSKAFLLYFSKPIGALDYLVGKLSAAVFFVLAITLFPALQLYAVSVALAPDVASMVATLPVLGRLVLASFAIGIPISMVGLFFSSLTKDHRIAAFGWVAFWIIGEMTYQLITAWGVETGHRMSWAFLASLREISRATTSAIFDYAGQVQHITDELAARGMDLAALSGRVARELGDDPHVSSMLDLRIDESTSYITTAAPFVLATLTVLCAVIVTRRVTKPVRI